MKIRDALQAAVTLAAIFIVACHAAEYMEDKAEDAQYSVIGNQPYQCTGCVIEAKDTEARRKEASVSKAYLKMSNKDRSSGIVYE